MSARRAQRRPRRGRLLLAAGAIAGAAFGVGVVCGAGAGPDERQTVERYAAAWQRTDWAALREQLTAADRDRRGAAALRKAYSGALDTATATRVTPGRPRDVGDGDWRLPVTVSTRAFGDVRGEMRLKLVDEDGEARVAWRPELVFPGLGPGERLRRTVRMPDRADLLARDGTPLAQGAERTSPLGAAAQAIVGAVGPIPKDRRAEAERLGYPADAQVGLTGLERTFDQRLAGRPGGELRAGLRLLASREPRKGEPVRTTIAPRVQEAAVTALAGRLGGVRAPARCWPRRASASAASSRPGRRSR
jgi:peptidoglycan glycosyltransferase